MTDTSKTLGEGSDCNKNTRVAILEESEKPVTSDASEERSRCSFRARSSSTGNTIPNLQRTRQKCRSLIRRTSVENFGQLGFLVPALTLFPQADGADALTQQLFGDLQKGHRELKLAAAHIDDALKGRGSFGKARSYFKPRLAQRCFHILDNPWFWRLIICNTLMHSFLIFFEPPSIPVLSVHPVVLALNLVCILIYIADLVVLIIFLTWPVFWSRKAEGGWWNGVEFVLVCFYSVDFILLVAARLSGLYIPQIFRSLRLALILCKVKNIRHIFNVLITIGFKLSKVFSIILVFVLMCACIGVHVLMDAYECSGPLKNSNSTTFHHGKKVPCYIEEEEKVYKGAFNHVAFGMLRLFVLLSTENFPEVMLPAIRVDPAYFIYFGLFVFVGVFFLTAILLAIVVDSYWVFSKKHVKKERARERAELAKAWNLLDPVGKGALGVDDEKFVKLFQILKPKNSEAENMLLIEMLDANEDGEVDSFEWTTMLRQVLSLEFEDDDDEVFFNESPGFSKWFIRAQDVARFLTESVIFPRFILLLIILHCVLFALKWRGQTLASALIIQVLRSVIVTVFLFEGVMRLLAIRKQILEPLEIMDLVLVLLAFCSNFVWYKNYPHPFWFRDYITTISSLSVFCRLPFNNRQLKQAISIFSRVAPVMVDLMCLLGIILFFIASVGMELFHDEPLPSDGHMYLPACGLGFQTFWCSCLILFQMVTTSNWHEIMNSVMQATGQCWTSLYFVAAYVLVNMVIMNLFVAIAIEAFNKLGTLDDDQMLPHMERQHSEARSSTAQTSVKHHAVLMLSGLASSLFGSTRADQVAERRQSLAAATANLGNNATRRGTMIKVEGATTGNKGDKRERVLKKRMKEKKQAKQKLSLAEHKVRVVTAFKGIQETDLNLRVGDEVTVLLKKDDWWQGRCRNKIGWFPASHVAFWTVKTLPEYGKRKSKPNEGGESEDVVRQPVTQADENSNKLQEPMKEKVPLSLYPKENSFFRERPSALGNQPLGTPPAVRGRMKMKKTGDWRREILGDMTLMNAEELRELNSIMRAELRTPSALHSKKLGFFRYASDDDSIRECPIAEDQEFMDVNSVCRSTSGRSQEPGPYSGGFLGKPGSPRFGCNVVDPLAGCPADLHSSGERSLSLHHVPVFQFSASERRPNPNRQVVHTTEEKKQTQKKGEMPDWMLKFVETNNLLVGEDVKLDVLKEQMKGRGSSSRAATSHPSSTRTASKSRSSRDSSELAKKSDAVSIRSRSHTLGSVTPAKRASRNSSP